MSNPPASPAMRALCMAIAGPRPPPLACPKGHRTIGVQLGVNGENAGRWYTSCIDRKCGFFKRLSDSPSVEMQQAINIQRQADGLSRDILKDAKQYRIKITRAQKGSSHARNGSSSQHHLTPFTSSHLPTSSHHPTSSRLHSSTLLATSSSVAPSSPLASKSKAPNTKFSTISKLHSKRKRSSSSLPDAEEVINGARAGKRTKSGRGIQSEADIIVISSDDDDIIIID